MNKILVVKQLQLPQELVDYLCSYLFYTIEQTTQRNISIFNEVVRDIDNLIIECYCASSGYMYNMHRVVHITNLYKPIDICIKLCVYCGEFYPRFNVKSKC